MVFQSWGLQVNVMQDHLMKFADITPDTVIVHNRDRDKPKQNNIKL
jgi:hypothetical protein